MTTTTALVEAHERAYESKDLDALLSTLSDDFVCAPLLGDPWLTGKPAARAMYADKVRDWPRSNTETLATMALGSVVVRRERTRAADLTRGSAETLAIYTVVDGLITRLDLAPPEGDEAAALDVATRQLAAYNDHALDAHCACFAGDIIVGDLGGPASITGIAAYRARYEAMFAQFPMNHAELVQRISLGSTVIDHERVRRTPDSAPFEVLAIYAVRGREISRVSFVRAPS